MTEEIKTQNSCKLLIEKQTADGFVEITLRMKNPGSCLLHWGVCRRSTSSWEIPPPASWPIGSRTFGSKALQTRFLNQNGDEEIAIRLDQPLNYSTIHFALFFPDENRWDNNHGKNYRIKLPCSERTSPPPIEVLKKEAKGKEIIFEEVIDMEEETQVAVIAARTGQLYEVFLATDILGPLLLHWGVAKKSQYEWLLPHDSILPPKTLSFEKTAAQTPLFFRDGLHQLKLEFPIDDAPLGIPFVLKQTETGQWIKKKGRHFFVTIHRPSHEGTFPEDPEVAEAAETIIHAEIGRNSITLMHRFNLCHDLLGRLRDSDEGLAVLFVWLRYSAIRQLDWQRNYNTKPKELSHAQDRLTLKLAEAYIQADTVNKNILRSIFTTLGRGGEGQRIRDDILHIMHRHRIKEVTGHFMEEWHQKLHNNTTPDDIVICEAYLAFLRSDGNHSLFYETLENGGVTKERLENFERPIVTSPDFVPHIKDGLIHDFENYLRLLKSVHSGTDMESAITSAGYIFDHDMKALADFLFWKRNDPSVPVEEFVRKVTDLRKRLNLQLKGERENGRVRDLLFLDLALEEFLRAAVERTIHSQLNNDQLVELTGELLKNMSFSHHDPELSHCLRHWTRLNETSRSGEDWAMHAKSVVDRMGRVVGSFIDGYYQRFQPKAEFLGNAFHAAAWTITLFSEEGVRGSSAFVLSMLLRHMDPILRKGANLGDWQIVSRGSGAGKVEVVEVLRSIQGKSFSSPTVVVAEKVMGDEDIPPEVTAVITQDATDIVSHVAVRARNQRLLFATCYDGKTFNELKSLKGQFVNLVVNASGDVEMAKGSNGTKTDIPHQKPLKRKMGKPHFSAYAITSGEFREGLVGGKSLNLMHLTDKLLSWIHLPCSVALPFGVCEKVLSQPANKELAKRYEQLMGGVRNEPKKNLAELRETILSLESTEELKSSLAKTMKSSKLKPPSNWEDTWRSIKRVWASKWNEAATFSRDSMGIPHEYLYMAVLIQEVIEAEYAFVIHTVNPITEDQDELYAEVVLGLGETLVGNYPGRALCFSSSKKEIGPRLLAYPGKSAGLFGGGWIFRSDSNGEDLADYAGAGLYDSILATPPCERLLDYSEERLIWNEGFRTKLLGDIAKIGVEVEKALNGSPQDIEGVYHNGRFTIVQTRPQV